MATADAAIMARVAGASVSTEIPSSDKSWICCMACFQNSVLANVFASYCQSKNFKVVVKFFRSLKKIF